VVRYLPRYFDNNAFADNTNLYGKSLTGDGTGSITGFNIPLYVSASLSLLDAITAVVDVRAYKTGGTGTSIDPYTGWDTEITWSAKTYYFPTGYYSYSASPNFAVKGIKLIGDGINSVLSFAGTGVAVNFDGGIGGGVLDVLMDGFLIKGNALATHGIKLKNIHHHKLRNISVVDVTTYGLLLDFSVLGNIENFSCTVNTGLSTFLPTTGIMIDDTWHGSLSTTHTIINPIIEGIGGTGIDLHKVLFSAIIGGVSESNTGYGLSIGASSASNTVIGTDFESNPAGGILIDGYNNTLINTSNTDNIIITGYNNKLFGGLNNGAVIVSGNFNKIEGTTYGASILDTGQGNIINDTYYTSTNNASLIRRNPRREEPTNLLSNGDFLAWTDNTTNPPNGWVLFGAGGTVAREGTIVKGGTYSAALTRAGTDTQLYQAVNATKGIGYWKGRNISFGCWVYATVAGRARLLIGTGAEQMYSAYHTGDSTWQWLNATHYVSSSSSNVTPSAHVDTGNTTAYFSGAKAEEGSVSTPFSPKPAEIINSLAVSTGAGTVKMGGASAGTNVGWVKVLDSSGTYIYLPYWSTDSP
jgi:hypothetical protein